MLRVVPGTLTSQTLKPAMNTKPLSPKQIEKLISKAPRNSEFNLTYGKQVKRAWDDPTLIWQLSTVTHLSRDATREWAASNTVFAITHNVVRKPKAPLSSVLACGGRLD